MDELNEYCFFTSLLTLSDTRWPPAIFCRFGHAVTEIDVSTPEKCIYGTALWVCARRGNAWPTVWSYRSRPAVGRLSNTAAHGACFSGPSDVIIGNRTPATTDIFQSGSSRPFHSLPWQPVYAWAASSRHGAGVTWVVEIEAVPDESDQLKHRSVCTARFVDCIALPISNKS